MDLDLDPSWVMWKAVVLEVVWVPAEVVVTSEVAKLIPPSELLLVCWGYYDPGNFHFESVAAVVTRVRFVSVFVGDCGKAGRENGSMECPDIGTYNGTYNAVILEKG